MIARAFLLALILLGGAGAAVVHFSSDAPRGFAGLIAGAAGAILAFTALIVVVTYGVSRSHASAVPSERRAAGSTILASALREFLAHVALFVLLIPFPRLWIRDGAPNGPSDADAPVLLVHGYLLNGAAWWRFVRFLERAGFRAHVVTLEPPLGPIEAMAEALGRRVEAVCAATDAPRVQLVAHSMGGLVCRAYLRAHGTARVARLVTIASPHRGTALARLGIGRAAREMAPGSAWLTALAESEQGSAHPPTLALFSYYDNYIAPQESGTLPWARNEPLPTLGHAEMHFSPRLAARVCEALRSREA